MSGGAEAAGVFEVGQPDKENVAVLLALERSHRVYVADQTIAFGGDLKVFKQGFVKSLPQTGQLKGWRVMGLTPVKADSTPALLSFSIPHLIAIVIALVPLFFKKMLAAGDGVSAGRVLVISGVPIISG